MSEKKTPCFKIYDHVQNTHIGLWRERCPGTGTALTLPSVPSLTLPKVPEALRQDRKGQEGLRSWSAGKQEGSEKAEGKREAASGGGYRRGFGGEEVRAAWSCLGEWQGQG